MKKRIALFLTMVMMTAMLSGCSVLDSVMSSLGEKEDITISSSDEKYSITAPGDWEDLKGELNENAVLEAGNLKKEQYLALLPDNKEDLALTFDEYTDIVYENILSAVSDAEEGERESVTVNGKTGYRMEVTGSVNNINVTYWIYCVDGTEDYLQILVWSLKSKAEDNKEVLLKAAESLTETAK